MIFKQWKTWFCIRYLNQATPNARLNHPLFFSITVLKWKRAWRTGCFTQGHEANIEVLSQSLNPGLSDNGNNVVSRAALYKQVSFVLSLCFAHYCCNLFISCYGWIVCYESFPYTIYLRLHSPVCMWGWGGGMRGCTDTGLGRRTFYEQYRTLWRVYVCACVRACVSVCNLPSGCFRGQRAICGSNFSPSIMWVLGMKLRFSGFPAGAFNHWSIFL